MGETNAQFEVQVVVLRGQHVNAKLNFALPWIRWHRVGHKLKGASA